MDEKKEHKQSDEEKRFTKYVNQTGILRAIREAITSLEVKPERPADGKGFVADDLEAKKIKALRKTAYEFRKQIEARHVSKVKPSKTAALEEQPK